MSPGVVAFQRGSEYFYLQSSVLGDSGVVVYLVQLGIRLVELWLVFQPAPCNADVLPCNDALQMCDAGVGKCQLGIVDGQRVFHLLVGQVRHAVVER